MGRATATSKTKVALITGEIPFEKVLDISNPESVEIIIRHDMKVVWVNIDGICALRACGIKKVSLITHDQGK
jgi:hypothetical protein